MNLFRNISYNNKFNKLLLFLSFIVFLSLHAIHNVLYVNNKITYNILFMCNYIND